MQKLILPGGEKINPVTFAVMVLGLRLYEWQARMMLSVWSGKPTTARTPNGAGKTSVIIVVLALCMLHEYPGATIVLTSASFRQVRDQVFAALKTHTPRFTGWSVKETAIETPEGGRIVGFATDSGGRFEGFHAYPDRPLLVIVDEAKTVDDEIFVAIDRCQPTHLLYISSPGGLLGRFYESFKNPRFAAFAITAADCPHITPEFIEAMRIQYGEDSDIYRSMIGGNFGSGMDDGKVIPFFALERCLAARTTHKPNRKTAFCDFAESGDENVVAKRDGNRLSIGDAWVGDGNTAAITMRFFGTLRQLQAEGYEIYGDADGTGHGYITALTQMGIKIRGVKNNATPADAHYFNLAAEMWWQFRRKVERGDLILPERDEVLKKQLVTREQVWRMVGDKKVYGREDGKLQLMPKSRISTKSPDRADAIVGAAYDYPPMDPVKVMGFGEEIGVGAALSEARGIAPGLVGADCG
jgi:hypothetical protein